MDGIMTPPKAEYAKTSLVTSQPIWLRRVLEDVGEKQEVTPILYGNKSAVVMSKNPVYYSGTNSGDSRIFFLEGLIKRNILDKR